MRVITGGKELNEEHIRKWLREIFDVELPEYLMRLFRMLTPECTDKCRVVRKSNRKHTWYEIEHHHTEE
jgi:hypothetical protein